MLGKAYLLLGRDNAAVQTFAKFVKLDPDHKDAAMLRKLIADYGSK